MSVFERLSRQPAGGKSYLFVILAGCAVLLVGAFVFASPVTYQGQWLIGLGLAFLGLMNVSLGAAELLPRHRTSLAALLRVAAISLGAISAGTMVAALWLMFV